LKEISFQPKSLVSVEVKNTGKRDGEEVVEVYLSRPDSASPVNPQRWLAAYKRLFLRAGEKQKVTLTVRPQELASYDAEGHRVIEAGPLIIAVGGKQPGFTGRLSAPTTTVVTAEIKIKR